jgi:hypothetical protein
MTPQRHTTGQATMTAFGIIALLSVAHAGAAEAADDGELIGDPFLNYFALGLLFFVVVVLFYGIIAIHDIPARIAHSRDHPHEDAIHAAGWVSLFTLHALWPFLWIWAMAYRPERGWGMHHEAADTPAAARHPDHDELENLRERLAALEGRLAADGAVKDAPPTSPVFKREAAR